MVACMKRLCQHGTLNCVSNVDKKWEQQEVLTERAGLVLPHAAHSLNVVFLSGGGALGRILNDTDAYKYGIWHPHMLNLIIHN